jgi:hypothetical protein
MANEKPDHGRAFLRPRTTSEYGVEKEEFIKAWEESESLPEVADRLKMPKAIVAARAAYYRSRGIDLKTMTRADRARTEANVMNALIHQVREAQARVGLPAAGRVSGVTLDDLKRVVKEAVKEAIEELVRRPPPR